MAKKKKSEKETPGFEESLADLEAIVAELESGNLPLSASIKRYEEGVGLLKQCHQTLDQIQRKIELLTGVNEQGEETTAAFDKSSNGSENAESDASTTSVEEAEDVDETGRLF